MEEDEEQKRDSLKREHHNVIEETEMEPKERQQTSSFSTKESLFSAPLRPPSIARVSGDHTESQSQSSPAIIAVNEEKKIDDKKGASVDDAEVTISISESKNKDEPVSEPQLVSYKKIVSPSLGK